MTTYIPDHMDNPNDLEPLALVSSEGLGLAPERVDLGAHELALRLDTSANWLLRGERPATPCVGAGDYLEAGRLLRQQAAEIERLRGVLAAIDKLSVSTLRTNSKDRGDWAEDVAFMGKLARGH